MVLFCLLASLAPCPLQAENLTLFPVIAGNGTPGYSGDNGPATSAELSFPFGVTVDGAGNLYIADTGNCRIRKVDANGIISTVAGNGLCGYNGDNIAATSAGLDPYGVAVDSAGNLYIADWGNGRTRKVDVNGIITTVAGSGIAVAVDSAGNLYIADYVGQRISKLDASGTITTVAGNGFCGYNGDNIAATSAALCYPVGVAVDSAGNLYIADEANQRIRKVDASGTITTVAGNGIWGYNGDNIAATSAELATPLGVAVDSAGNLYIADDDNERIRKVDASGTITSMAAVSEFFTPIGLAADRADNLYIVEEVLQRVRLLARYKASVQQPINAGGSSVFSATRGVVPVKFTLTEYDVQTEQYGATCTLPPATIGITRTAGGTLGSVDESTYLTNADSGSNFRNDGCQYVYNLATRSLGVGTYRVDISINGSVVGQAVFALK
jgi:sugar lactone lactonase YvrE